jgi:hypothetical protein
MLAWQTLKDDGACGDQSLDVYTGSETHGFQQESQIFRDDIA